MWRFPTTFARGAAALFLAAAGTIPLAAMSRVEAHRVADTLPATSGPNLLVNGGFENGADPGSQLALAAGNNASVALVVDYPDGTQLLAPLKTGPDGHYTYTWKVPSTVHGLVRVLVDSVGKTAHAGFMVQ